VISETDAILFESNILRCFRRGFSNNERCHSL